MDSDRREVQVQRAPTGPEGIRNLKSNAGQVGAEAPLAQSIQDRIARKGMVCDETKATATRPKMRKQKIMVVILKPVRGETGSKLASAMPSYAESLM
jgi:hypothetical protein